MTGVFKLKGKLDGPWPICLIRFAGTERINFLFCRGIFMRKITASEARSKLYKLVDQAAESHEPIQITGKRFNAILISSGRLALNPGDSMPVIRSRHADLHPQGTRDPD